MIYELSFYCLNWELKNSVLTKLPDITYMWNLKMTQMNLSAKQTQIHRQIRLVVTKGEKVEEGLMSSLGLADANYYLWTNKVLLCSTVYHSNGRK